MAAYDIDKLHWTFLLVLKQTEKVQLVYTAIEMTEASDYATIKKTILKRGMMLTKNWIAAGSA